MVCIFPVCRQSGETCGSRLLLVFPEHVSPNTVIQRNPATFPESMFRQLAQSQCFPPTWSPHKNSKYSSGIYNHIFSGCHLWRRALGEGTGVLPTQDYMCAHCARRAEFARVMVQRLSDLHCMTCECSRRRRCPLPEGGLWPEGELVLPEDDRVLPPREALGS